MTATLWIVLGSKPATSAAGKTKVVYRHTYCFLYRSFWSSWNFWWFSRAAPFRAYCSSQAVRQPGHKWLTYLCGSDSSEERPMLLFAIQSFLFPIHIAVNLSLLKKKSIFLSFNCNHLQTPITLPGKHSEQSKSNHRGEGSLQKGASDTQ